MYSDLLSAVRFILITPINSPPFCNAEVGRDPPRSALILPSLLKAIFFGFKFLWA